MLEVRSENTEMIIHRLHSAASEAATKPDVTTDDTQCHPDAYGRVSQDHPQITQIVVQKPEPGRTVHRLGLLTNPTHERSEGSSNSLGIIISKILRCAQNDERRPSSTALDSAGVPIQNLD
jgi:hypothetical protein